MFNKEKRQEKRERRETVKAELKRQIKPRETFGQRQEASAKREERDVKQARRRDVAKAHLTALHSGNPSKDVVQLGSDLLYIPALSNLQFQIQDQMASSEKVYSRWTVYGKHDNEFLGMAPTNRDVQFGGVSISLLSEDEVVTQEVHFWDMVALLQQIQAP